MSDRLPHAYDAIPDIGFLYDCVPLYSARADAAFYAGEAARANGEVLEIGCGTGRILLPIARAGRTITGVDTSPAMLERCRQKLAAEPDDVRRRVTLHEGTAGSLARREAFALITAPFRVLQHLQDVASQLRLLEAVRGLLAPGGRFIFDVFNPHFVRMTADRSAEAEDTAEFELPDGRRFRRTARVPRVHWVDQVSEVELIYYVTTNGTTERFVQAFNMRWYQRHELEHLAVRAGFRVVDVLGDFARGELTDESPEQIWCLERA